ncbi:MAG: hypothetical protein JWO51_133 [Rhodospirillales bacterium]|nr:hypothetical protein [Rhodospirillales bacterium]
MAISSNHIIHYEYTTLMESAFHVIENILKLYEMMKRMICDRRLKFDFREVIVYVALNKFKMLSDAGLIAKDFGLIYYGSVHFYTKKPEIYV